MEENTAASKCEHLHFREWDCYCTYGPPSCISCHIRAECLDCRRMLNFIPNQHKIAKRQCNLCDEKFVTKAELKVHRKIHK
jgi:hypothetical protein